MAKQQKLVVDFAAESKQYNIQNFIRLKDSIESMIEQIFSGEDRIEVSQKFGRPIRMGDPKLLSRSDLSVVLEKISNSQFQSAKAHAELLHFIYQMVVGTFLEWCIALPAELSPRVATDIEQKVRTESYVLFKEAIIEQASRYSDSSIMEAVEFLHPESTSPNAIDTIRKAKDNLDETVIDRLLKIPNKIFADFLTALDESNPKLASSLYWSYFTEIRARHDIMGHYISIYGGVVSRVVSEKVSVDVMQEGLESCAVLEHMWNAFENLPQPEVALMLAEHLRAHYSGLNREGAVKVIEEVDRYRLVFEPCGTGGSMRLDKIKGLTVLNEAAPYTWNLSGQVPPYCAHCAKNELTSIQKLGYPVWVTEFNPDPSMPCGWTVYKNPNDIPDSYFTRLGAKKDPTRFKIKN